MGFKETTIFNHLKYAHEEGLPLDTDRLRTESTLSLEDERLVVESFEEHGTEYLKPVFDALNETVSYDQLRLWRVICLVNSAQK